MVKPVVTEFDALQGKIGVIMTVFKSLLWVMGIVCSMMWGGTLAIIVYLIISCVIEYKKLPS